ncbi:MAG: NAD(+)/NADH kinase [Lachnospiraceae bacterium]|nr:NAD(+)/NADH kinase [Lachnospiraceae bacterium]
MKRFYIMPNHLKDVDLKIAFSVREELYRCDPGVEVVVEENIEERSSGRITAETECIIVLGGDGTMIRAANDIVGLGIPLIGINLGTLGYLTEIERNNIPGAMRQLVSDDYHIEERMMLAGLVDCKGTGAKTAGIEAISALNDVVLTRRGDFQIIGYRVSVNGKYLNDFYADGIILSTPTGSSGYNLSAGGSIVEPKARLIVLTPVCPHTMSTRSIILSPEDKIEIEVLPPRGEKLVEVEACFDGTGQAILHPGDRVTVFRSSQVTKMIKLSDVGFLEVLHKRLSV